MSGGPVYYRTSTDELVAERERLLVELETEYSRDVQRDLRARIIRLGQALLDRRGYVYGVCETRLQDAGGL